MFAFTKLMQAMVASGSVSDPQFYLTTLLLNTSSTNGAQNNTFLDSSSNNFTITRNGNTTQGTFTPFSQTGWGIYNTASSYCQLNNADYSIGTGDFTFEFWMYCVDDSTYGSSAFAGLPGAGVLTVSMTSGSSGARQPYMEFGGSGTLFTAFSNYLNKWTHVAFVRSSGTITVYQNGTALSSASKSASFPNTANLYLLRTPGDTAQDFRGYISNFRICKSAVYTSTFTPSTIPLTTTSQSATSCQLLTFQDNRFKDNSSNASTVTPSGSTAIQAFSPFLPTAAYDAAVVGGSGYFDGSGDYLTAPNNAAFNLGSNNFTIECWYYQTTTPNSASLISQWQSANDANSSWQLLAAGGTNLTPTFAFNVTSPVTITSSTATVLNAWYHIAAVRNGSTVTLYLNGVSVGSSAISGSIKSVTNPVGIGVRGGSTSDLIFAGGYISSPRIVNGTAVYTANFTPPTAPPTAITNTSLLLSCTNAGIYDSAAKNVLETVGNAQVSTTQAKWGTTSLYCPATNGNYFVSPPNQQNFIFGTGNFTVEAWIYPTAFTNTATGLIGYGLSGGYVDWNLEINTSGTVLYIDNDTGRFSSSSNLSTNTWTHIAIVRTNTAVTMYFNGTSVGSYSTINNITGNSSSARLYVGTGAQSPGARQFIGYIDDPRISKYARYTTTFTPPTAAFAIQ